MEDTMSSGPKVSIIIPVYNGANFLREAIESALSQTYHNVEVIVVNDGSCDDGKTDEIACSYGRRIRYFSKQNGGVASALNLGIRVMEGEYFSWLSHDDVYFPDKIERQIAQLQKIGHNVILYGDHDYIDENSRYLSTKKVMAPQPSEFRLSLLYSHPVHGCTLLIPRHFLIEAGLFDESLRTTQDYDLWFRMSSKYDFVHICSGPLIKSRVHSQQGIRSTRPLFLKECDELYFIRLREVISGWNEELGAATKLVFLFKVAVFLERCGHKQALAFCRTNLTNAFRQSFRLFDWKCWYWTTYYGLFRAKRLVWR